MFADGILTFEVRMVVLLIGLITGYLALATAVVAVGAGITVLQRLARISNRI
jgi:ActR/RegA family two-component response regulator